MEGRRNHVLGQRLAKLIPQRVGIERPLGGVEGHQVLALIGSAGDPHCTFADAAQPQKRILNFADLYPEATDLDLSIPAAEKLQLALGQPAPIVPTPVEPLALAVRIDQEGSAGGARGGCWSAPPPHTRGNEFPRGAGPGPRAGVL